MSFKWFSECLACGCKELYTTVDLGEVSLPNYYPKTPNEVLDKYPLGLNMCDDCKHTQLFGVPDVPMFEDYSYVNTALSFKLHQEALVTWCFKRMHVGYMLDVGGNNGDLAREFIKQCVSASVIDPSRNLELERFNKNIPSLTAYFTLEVAANLKYPPDLITMCNVLPHVPDPEGMLRAAKSALFTGPNSKILVEFVYFKSTYELRDLGQIYFEHCSYFTLNSLLALVERAEMSITDIEFFPNVHGGTIRALIDPNLSGNCPKFYEMLQAENLSGVIDFEELRRWGDLLKANVEELKMANVMSNAMRPRVFYGASAKASTLFGMKSMKDIEDMFDYAVDDNPLKQGRYIPNTNIPIKSPKELEKEDNPIIIIGAHNHFADIIKRIKALTPKATIINYVPTVTVEEITR